MNRLFKFAAIVCLSIAFDRVASAQSNSLIWRQAAGRVDADVHNEALLPLLRSIAAQTGWHVYVEPGATANASTKFTNLPSGDALKMLLGNLNFALVPQNGAPWQLYVFRTAMKNATHLIASNKPKHAANELMVKIKPGTDINALAKMLNANIVGKMDKFGVYLLQFPTADATDSALSQLQMDSDVQAVDYNTDLDPLPTPQSISSAPIGPLSLTLNPPPSSGNVIVGLIDTDVESLGSELDPFILKQINVADGSTSDSTTNQGTATQQSKVLQMATAAPSDSTITHGTAMAYTILSAIANSTGNGTSVEIQPVNVYGSNTTTTSWNVALGVQAAVNAGATVLNMSLGSSGDSSVLNALLAQAASEGITSFGAAGNTPIDAPYYPAADTGVIPVTALGQPGQLASYANSWPDPSMIALPGTGIVYYEGEPWIVEGTSTSTAEASGVFAGNLAARGWTQKQIISAMDSKFPVPAQ